MVPVFSGCAVVSVSDSGTTRSPAKRGAAIGKRAAGALQSCSRNP